MPILINVAGVFSKRGIRTDLTHKQLLPKHRAWETCLGQRKKSNVDTGNLSAERGNKIRRANIILVPLSSSKASPALPKHFKGMLVR